MTLSFIKTINMAVAFVNISVAGYHVAPWTPLLLLLKPVSPHPRRLNGAHSTRRVSPEVSIKEALADLIGMHTYIETTDPTVYR